MTRQRLRALVDHLKLRIDRSDGEGIVVIRTGTVSYRPDGAAFLVGTRPFGVWVEERWRLRCGSGIGGMSGRWAIEPVHGSAPSIGGLETVKAAEKALRAWRRFEAP